MTKRFALKLLLTVWAVVLAGGCDSTTKPPTPTALTVKAGSTQNTISWTGATNATSYNLYWSTSSGVNKSSSNKIAGVTSPYVHAGLTNNQAYYYVLTSVDNKGTESSESVQATGMPSPSKAFVVNSANSTISIIDTATNTSVATVTVGANPVAVAADSSNNRAYTANNKSDTVSVVDTVNYLVIATVTVGSQPSAIVINTTTRKIYIANYGSNTVSIIDGATNQVSSPVSVGQRPNAISVNVGTNKIYVTNSIDNTVSVIDGATSQVVQTVPVGGGAGGVVTQ